METTRITNASTKTNGAAKAASTPPPEADVTASQADAMTAADAREAMIGKAAHRLRMATSELIELEFQPPAVLPVLREWLAARDTLELINADRLASDAPHANVTRSWIEISLAHIVEGNGKTPAMLRAIADMGEFEETGIDLHAAASVLGRTAEAIDLLTEALVGLPEETERRETIAAAAPADPDPEYLYPYIRRLRRALTCAQKESLLAMGEIARDTSSVAEKCEQLGHVVANLADLESELHEIETHTGEFRHRPAAS